MVSDGIRKDQITESYNTILEFQLDFSYSISHRREKKYIEILLGRVP